MLLNDRRIREIGPSVVTPFDEEMVQPASIDLRLDHTFYIDDHRQNRTLLHNPTYDISENMSKLVISKDDSFVLRSGDFALASTYERVKMPNNLGGRFEGKSSLGRIGLFTHVTAGFIDPGFEGHITVELYNSLSTAVVLFPGMKIGQLCFMQMNADAENPYGSGAAGSHYQGQRGPTPSRLHERLHITDVYSDE